jgi:hypothetical protein
VIAKAIGTVLGLAAIAVVALLFLGGSISSVHPPIGSDAFGPEGFISLALPLGSDIACPDSGDDPCHPSPVPTINPGVAKRATPLGLPSVDVLVDHAGEYSVLAGTATLPNGVLTQAEAVLADDLRPELRLRQDVVRLVILGEDGEPRGNKWTDGWHPGLEPVEVRLEFEVTSLDGPTTLEFTDIVVR